MELILYKDFGKRKNSTKQPDSTVQSVTKQVRLKQGTSVLSPTFLLSDPDPNYNYCKWRWRYYYITDIVLNNDNVYEIQCEVDPMASWKNNIGASQQYVLRSASTWDWDIVDTMYPAKATPVVKEVAISVNGMNLDFNTGTIIMGALVRQTTDSEGGLTYPPSGTVSQGCVTYLYGTPNGLKIVGSQLLDASKYNFDEAQIYNYNPLQYIKSVKWFPFTAPVTAAGATSMPLGLIPTPLYFTHKGLSSSTADYTFTASIDRPSWILPRGDFYLKSPWAKYTLNLPMFGEIPLDPDLVGSSGGIVGHIVVDFIAGEAVLIILTADGKHLTTRVCNVATDISLSEVGANRLGAAATYLTSGAALASSLVSQNITGIAGAISGIMSGIQSEFPQSTTNGTNGSLAGAMSALYVAPTLTCVYREPVAEHLLDKGRPLCQEKVISTLSGFVQCSDVHIGWQAMPAEKDTITSFMESGFFYE